MIPIQNIYYMLSYAFQVLKEQGYKNLATESFSNTADLCAAILSKGVSVQIKRGLGREYIEQTESLSTPRGRLEISQSIKTRSMLKKQLICSYDNFSVNSYMNRIIKTTMVLLLGADISKVRKKELKSLYRKIVKALHPDLHPDLSDAERQLFENAVTAYKNGDLLSIRVIYETIGDGLAVPDDADTMQALMKTKKHLEELIAGINEEIAKIKGRYPYTERDLLADDEKVEERKAQLRGALEQYQKLCNVYLERITALKG